MTQSLSATATVIAAIRRCVESRGAPVVIAIDGRSGSGKSTLAAAVADESAATVVPCDDFFAAEIASVGWNARDAKARARDAVDWRRLRRDALEPLRARCVARWQAFDFEAGVRDDGTYAMRADYVERAPAAVVILDGAYSSRPELADLVDLSILVEASSRARAERLGLRESADFLAAWHARWDAAEDYYFANVRPASTFDVVVALDGVLGLERGRVRVVPYDPLWPYLFNAEARRIEASMHPLPIAIRHTGSTAVPGLPAKPILNVLAGIPANADFPPYIERVVAAGYVHRGEQGIPGREFFRRGTSRSHHLHMTQIDSDFWRDHLAFRDYLRTHSRSRDEYGMLKLELQNKYSSDREQYIDAKGPFVRRVLELARKSAG